MSTCTNCDAVISPGSTTCTSCGAPQRRQVCDNCGATLKSGAKSCGQCGSKRWKGPMQKQEDNESIPKRHKRPKTWRQKEEKEQEKVYTDEQKRRQSDPKVQVETREGESWEKFKERQDKAEDPREHKTLQQRINAYQQQARANAVCTKCGNTMMLNAKFCSNCGTARN